jgi:hypothetical protein
VEDLLSTPRENAEGIELSVWRIHRKIGMSGGLFSHQPLRETRLRNRRCIEGLGGPIENAIVVGDSIWDMLAASCCRALGVGLLSGGYGAEELRQAGAIRVYDDPADILSSFMYEAAVSINR